MTVAFIGGESGGCKIIENMSFSSEKKAVNGISPELILYIWFWEKNTEIIIN